MDSNGPSNPYLANLIFLWYVVRITVAICAFGALCAWLSGATP